MGLQRGVFFEVGGWVGLLRGGGGARYGYFLEPHIIILTSDNPGSLHVHVHCIQFIAYMY